jgi:hypothetical protein
MMTIEGQQKSAIISEEEKRKTLQVEYQLKQQLIIAQGGIDKELLGIKLEGETKIAAMNADSKIMTGQDQAYGKLVASQVAAQGGIDKQKVANEKPQSKAA